MLMLSDVVGASVHFEFGTLGAAYYYVVIRYRVGKRSVPKWVSESAVEYRKSWQMALGWWAAVRLTAAWQWRR